QRETECTGTRKYPVGAGIMNSSGTLTHGAGPTGHTTAVRILSKGSKPTKMEVDSAASPAEKDSPVNGDDSKKGSDKSGDAMATKHTTKTNDHSGRAVDP
ncbi:hypothetical protein MPER_02346, partial [Moniliophthora perniciosa FA553]